MPKPDEDRLPVDLLLRVVAATLREQASAAPPDGRRDLLIAARLTDIVRRDVGLGAAVAARRAARLQALGAADERDLARQIRDRSSGHDHRRLAAELLAAADDQLTIDNPDYGATGR